MEKKLYSNPGNIQARGREMVQVETNPKICTDMTGFRLYQNILTPSGESAFLMGVSIHPHDSKRYIPWYLKLGQDGATYWDCGGTLSPEALIEAGFMEDLG